MDFDQFPQDHAYWTHLFFPAFPRLRQAGQAGDITIDETPFFSLFHHTFHPLTTASISNSLPDVPWPVN
jgi:hypothetical protein